MKALKTSPDLNEQLSLSQDGSSNGIENYEVATVQPGKGARYRFPYSGGLFSEAAKRRMYRQKEISDNEGVYLASEI